MMGNTVEIRKDLLVVTGNVYAQAVLKSVLENLKSTSKISIKFDVERYPISGFRFFKDIIYYFMLRESEYSHFIVVYDIKDVKYRSKLDECAESLNNKLKPPILRSAAHVVPIDPEIEAWLWCDRGGLTYAFADCHDHSNLSEEQINKSIKGIIEMTNNYNIVMTNPKYVLEELYRLSKGRDASEGRLGLLPDDYSRVISKSDLNKWYECDTSYRCFFNQLKSWFSPRDQTSRGHTRVVR
ncbi:MAG: hypothetical protein HQL79_02310 [Magnetococcales bacterium]|nr:hypothetical protein [Magnetococcales bacterium]